MASYYPIPYPIFDQKALSNQISPEATVPKFAMEEKKSAAKDEKEEQLLLEQESDRYASYAKSGHNIIITGNVDENKNYDFKKIILLSDYKKAA